MNKADQQAAAKELYFQGWDQNDIARIVKVTENTMTKWVKIGNWKEERATKFSLNDSISNQLLELIDYQLTAIRERVSEWKKSGEKKLIDKGEIDALSKMFASVKQKDILWTHYVNVCRELADFVATKDPEFTKALVEFTDAFLMNKRDHIS